MTVQGANVSPWTAGSFPAGATGTFLPKDMFSETVVDQDLFKRLYAVISEDAGFPKGLQQFALNPKAETKEANKMATEGELRAAEIAAAEARTDTKIAKLEGKLDLVISKLDAINETTSATRKEVKDSERAVKANGWVIFGALLAAIVVIAFGLPAVFDLGTKLRDTIAKEVQVQLHKQDQTPKE